MTDVPESRLRQLAHELQDAAPPPLPWSAVATTTASVGGPAAPPQPRPSRTRWRLAVGGVVVAGVAALAVVAIRDRDEPPTADDVSPTTVLATVPPSGAPTDPAVTDPGAGWGALGARTFDAIGFDGLDWPFNRTLTIEFSGTDQLVVQGACNGITATAHLDGDTLAVDDLASTLVGCGAEQGVDPTLVDLRLVELLRSSPTLVLDGDDLTISGDPGREPIVLTFRDRVALGTPVEGSVLWAELTDRSFDAISIEGLDWPDDRDLRVGFANGRVLVEGACNEVGAPAMIEGDVLVADTVESTDVGCEPEIQQLDDAIAELLLARPTISLDGDVLTLSATVAGGPVVITLQDRLTAGVETPFEGTTWSLVASTVGIESYPDIPAGSVRLRFDGGVLTVVTPCGTVSGSYRHDPNAVESSGVLELFTLPDPPSPCAGDAALAAEVIATLRAATDEQIHGTELRIQARADAALTLQPEPAAAASPIPVAVSFAAPPPMLDLTPFATIDLAEGSCGPGCVPQTAVLDDGRVAVVDVYGLRVLLIDGSGAVEELALDMPYAPTTVTAGPGGVLYGVAPAPEANQAAARYVAIPTTGPLAGTVVASAPTSMAIWVELPPVMLGLGPTGVVDRRSGEVVLGYVDAAGASLAADITGERYTHLGDGTIFDSSLTPRWTLDVVRDPGYVGGYVGDPPPVAAAGGRAVVTTALGPPFDDTDFSPPTLPVMAILEAGGSGTWWSIPDGWQLVASDEWGTALARRVGNTVELALL